MPLIFYLHYSKPDVIPTTAIINGTVTILYGIRLNDSHALQYVKDAVHLTATADAVAAASREHRCYEVSY